MWSNQHQLGNGRRESILFIRSPFHINMHASGENIQRSRSNDLNLRLEPKCPQTSDLAFDLAIPFGVDRERSPFVGRRVPQRR